MYYRLLAGLQGCLWALLAAFKVSDSEALRTFLSNEVGLPMASVAAAALIGMEALLGGLMLASALQLPAPPVKWTASVAAAVSVGALGVTFAMRGATTTCGCLGATSTAHWSLRLFVAAALLSMAVALLHRSRAPSHGGAKRLLRVAPMLLGCAALLLILLGVNRTETTPPIEPMAEVIPEPAAPPSLLGSGSKDDTGTATAGRKASHSVLRGIVRHSGRPIAGAKVYLTAGADETVDRERVVTSDETGQFALVPGQEHRYVHVTAHGYVPQMQLLDLAREHEPWVVDLSAGDSIEGRVVDSSRQAVAGARVCVRLDASRLAYLRSDGDMLPSSLAVGGVVRSDEEGRFVVAGLVEGHAYRLRATTDRACSFEEEVATAGQSGVLLTVVQDMLLQVDISARGDSAAPLLSSIVLEVPPGMVVADHDVYRLRRQWMQQPAASHEGVQYSWLIRRDPSTVVEKAGAPSTTTLSVAAMGFDEVKETVPIRLGEVVQVHVELDRSPDVRLGDVAFAAHFQGGTPYNGWLFIGLRNTETRAFHGRHVLFDEGKSTQPLSIPRGRYLVVARGHRQLRSGMFWNPAATNGAIDVAEGRKDEIRLTLEGTPVALRVRSERGGDLGGYDLSVKGPSGDLRWQWAWDLHRRLEPGAPDAVVWLRPGRSTVTASIPGWGKGSVEVDAPGDGSPMAAEIVIEPGD